MFHDTSLLTMVNMLLFFLAGATTGLAASTSTAAGYVSRCAIPSTGRGARQPAT
jgi:hypothetical protein